MAQIFNRRKIMNAALGGAAFTLLNEASRAGMPLLPPTSLDEYINNHGNFIYTGYFNRVVSITWELGKKLFDPQLEIDPDELRLYDVVEGLKSSSIFFEITNARLRLINENINGLKARVSRCNFEKLYFPGFDLNSFGDKGEYYRDLLNGEVILFLTAEAGYGWNARKFPQPFFLTAAGVHWRNGSPMPISEFGRVSAMAKNAGYVEPGPDICKK